MRFESLTFKFDVKTTKFQFNSLKCFPQGFMVMADAFFWSHAEREREVFVRFLAIVVGSYSIHPQNNFLFILVLKDKVIELDEKPSRIKMSKKLSFILTSRAGLLNHRHI